MCLVALGLEVSNEYVLVLAANRDELHGRATAPANWWPEHPTLLGGRDLVAGGTWLGVARTGRVAALTNVHEPERRRAPRSRGDLVASFLKTRAPAREFAGGLAPGLDRYGPFNLLLYDGAELRYVSNRAPPSALGQGIHVLSNAAPTVDWPKVRRARAGLAEWLEAGSEPAALLELLAERAPQHGSPEYYREALFVEGDGYGTRCSTVLTIAHSGRVTFIERRFDAAQRITGEDRYDFELEAAGRALRS
jgi:uncharacterized protein with NRDE domain